MDGWMDGWMGGLMGGLMGGWVDGWMGGWVDGWIPLIVHTCACLSAETSLSMYKRLALAVATA